MVCDFSVRTNMPHWSTIISTNLGPYMPGLVEPSRDFYPSEWVPKIHQELQIRGIDTICMGTDSSPVIPSVLYVLLSLARQCDGVSEEQREIYFAAEEGYLAAHDRMCP